MNSRSLLWAATALVMVGCGTSTTSSTPDDAILDDASDVAAGSDATEGSDTGSGDVGGDVSTDVVVAPPGDATCTVRGGVEQVFVTHAGVGEALELRDDTTGKVFAAAKADYLGTIVFRKVTPGFYRVWTAGTTPEHKSNQVTVLAVDASLPPQTFYSSQVITPGNGYITTRDGTTLAYFATLPGPADAGPYPTIVNYSGYDPGRPGHAVVSGDLASLCDGIPILCNAPSDPSAMIAGALGYATVSVNIRGTGCSGGAYDYFETMQLLDGYDIIETVAAQPWVRFHKVGMTGLSYPGITQLFVAKTQPPSLAAITPLSVIGNTATTLVPGGILNSGFALNWINMVYNRASPYGQGWEQGRVDGGDLVCKENQLLHDQRINNVEQAKNSAYYEPTVITPLNPTAWADKIKVPVFLACGWQDEQTGPFFVTLLDKFVNAPNRRFTVYNGVHSDGFSPQVLAEWKAFLDIYVAHEKPSVGGIMGILAPQLTQQVFGATLPMPPDRWTGVTTWEEAKAKWEAEPDVNVHFEDGATAPIGTPHENFGLQFGQWPPKETTPQRWYFHNDGTLLAAQPTETTGGSTFALDPDAGGRGIMGPKGGLWNALPDYSWLIPDAQHEVAFTSEPLTDDLVMLGTGSVDVWIRSMAADVTDADLEVTLTEVRPDGQERYVQSGWLRASFRKLTAASTDLFPEPELLAASAQPLPIGQWVKVRVATAGFGHAFRKGTRIRVAIDTPGDSRADWRFDLKTWPHPVTYDVAHSATYPSSVLLPVIGGAKVPESAPNPPCPSLRGQQCRTFVDVANTPAAP